CITARAVTVPHFYTQGVTKIAETVRRKARKYLAAQSHCAQSFRIVFITVGQKVTFQKGVIKVDIVCHEDLIVQEMINLLSHFFKGWCSGYHLIRDACQSLYVSWNRLMWIDESFEFVDRLVAIENIYGNFSNAMSRGITTGSFYVNDSVHE